MRHTVADVPSTVPLGEPVPLDGRLPRSALETVASTPFSLYLHVPFCRTRCGYCDFNTYTANELQGSSIGSYLAAAHRELDLAASVMGSAPPAQTVFFGGGTPTLLSADQLGGFVQHARDAFGLADDAEVTTEANPETVTAELLEGLLDGGVNRISLGMQSSDQDVLRVLDRVHTPGRAVAAAELAHRVGFEEVSLDLIYGTPGETLDSYRRSLESALAADPEHISAYALIVEEGTGLAQRIRRGELAMTDDDDLADKYPLTDELLTAAGLDWYEVSNFARGERHRARHNMAYWLSHNWWGIGPGAHSHIGGVRWWNRKHPRSYAAALSEGGSPGAGREVLCAGEVRVEQVMLELRLRDGLDISVLSSGERGRLARFFDDALLERRGDRLVLSLAGRLLADAVVRDLLD